MSKTQKQFRFTDQRIKAQSFFGGSLMTKAKNRHDRPVSSKHPMHIVLRSSKAKGAFSFAHAKNFKRVREIVEQHSKRYGVKLIEFSNNFNHLHLMVKFPSRQIYLRYIRSLTGSLALAVTGASKMKALKEIAKGKFFDYRPFTRVIKSLKAYFVAKDYLVLNQLEAIGVLPKRSGRLKDVGRGEYHYFRDLRAGRSFALR